MQDDASAQLQLCEVHLYDHELTTLKLNLFHANNYDGTGKGDEIRSLQQEIQRMENIAPE